MSVLIKTAHRNADGNYTAKHIDHEHKTVNRTIRAFALSTAILALGACSVSNDIAAISTQEELVTSSVTKPVEPEGISSSDAEIIKTAVTESESENLLAWQNPDSGSKGTITAIDNFIGSHGQQCKKFQTTVDTFMGISLYNGETCKLKKGFWVLSWFLKDGNQS